MLLSAESSKGAHACRVRLCGTAVAGSLSRKMCRLTRVHLHSRPHIHEASSLRLHLRGHPVAHHGPRLFLRPHSPLPTPRHSQPHPLRRSPPQTHPPRHPGGNPRSPNPHAPPLASLLLAPHHLFPPRHSRHAYRPQSQVPHHAIRHHQTHHRYRRRKRWRRRAHQHASPRQLRNSLHPPPPPPLAPHQLAIHFLHPLPLTRPLLPSPSGRVANRNNSPIRRRSSRHLQLRARHPRQILTLSNHGALEDRAAGNERGSDG